MANQIFPIIQTETEENIKNIASEVIILKGSRPNEIKVWGRTDKIILDVHLDAPYGCLIPDLAFQIQGKIASKCEKELGIKLNKININVDGIYFSPAGEK